MSLIVTSFYRGNMFMSLLDQFMIKWIHYSTILFELYIQIIYVLYLYVYIFETCHSWLQASAASLNISCLLCCPSTLVLAQQKNMTPRKNASIHVPVCVRSTCIFTLDHDNPQPMSSKKCIRRITVTHGLLSTWTGCKQGICAHMMNWLFRSYENPL